MKNRQLPSRDPLEAQPPARTRGCNGVCLIRLRQSFQNFPFRKFKFSFQFPRVTIPDGPRCSDKIETDLQSLLQLQGMETESLAEVVFLISKCFYAEVRSMHCPFHMERGAKLKTETRQVVSKQRESPLPRRLTALNSKEAVPFSQPLLTFPFYFFTFPATKKGRLSVQMII